SSANGSFAITCLNLIQNRRRTLSLSCASLSAGSNPTLWSDVAIAPALTRVAHDLGRKTGAHFSGSCACAADRCACHPVGDSIPLPQAPSMHSKLPCDAVHRFRQLDVEAGEAAGVVGCQHHLDGLVDVAPFRVMVLLLGDQRDARHEAEGFV